jgi:anion-transporting  ArsA/GET3 family ATPase
LTTTTPAKSPLLQAPVVYVTGKGGVGKTTVAAAIACDASRRGQRAALVEFDDGEAGARTLGADRSHVAHLVLQYDKALVDTLGSVLGAKIIARALVSHPALRRLIAAVPALREFAFLDRVCALASSKRYDRIVVDLPASGHALDWLRVPNAFARFLGRSPLGNLGRRIHNEVVVAGQSEVIVVTLAEPLVVKETEQLCARLRRELGTVPALVVVNRVVQPDPDGAWEAVTALAEQDPEMAGDANELMDILRARGDQADDTAYALGLARSVEARHVVPLPDAARDPLASEVVQWLRAEVPT